MSTMRWCRRFLWGYMGAPKTIGDAALFLASDLSAYITGTQLVVDGGIINQ